MKILAKLKYEERRCYIVNTYRDNANYDLATVIFENGDFATCAVLDLVCIDTAYKIKGE